AVTALLLVDHDIQRSIDRIAEAAQAFRVSTKSWIAGRIDDYRERREQLAEEEAARDDARSKRSTNPDRSRTPFQGNDADPDPTGETADSRVSGDGSSRTINDLYRSSTSTEPPQPTIESPPPSPPPRSPRSGTEPELHVQERIEEERADSVERVTDVPNQRDAARYRFPTIDLLDERDVNAAPVNYDELEENKRILLDKLETYNIEISSINAIVGPTVTLYELTTAPGVKISRITSLEDDLAMAIAAKCIGKIAPIPGMSAVGVDIPSRHREWGQNRDVISTARCRDSKMELPVPFGKTIEGEVFMQDLTKLPHLLIAGATGSGKSVGLNALITGLLYACHPANLKFVMIDPKKIELQQYKAIADHFVAMPENGSDPIITDFDEALGVLKSCEREMEVR